MVEETMERCEGEGEVWGQMVKKSYVVVKDDV